VVIAVIAVRVVQVAFDQVIDVVAVRNGFVAAARAVLVFLVVLAAIVLRSALGWVAGIDRELMLLDAAFGHVVQVAVVQVVHVAFVTDGGVAAAGAVLVCVVGMVTRHG
jgi:hypothetical protein